MKRQEITWQEIVANPDKYSELTVLADGYEECGVCGHYEPWAHEHKVEFTLSLGDSLPCAVNDEGYFFNEEHADYFIENGKLYAYPDDLYYREPITEEEIEYFNNLPDEFWEELKRYNDSLES